MSLRCAIRVSSIYIWSEKSNKRSYKDVNLSPLRGQTQVPVIIHADDFLAHQYSPSLMNVSEMTDVPNSDTHRAQRAKTAESLPVLCVSVQITNISNKTLFKRI